jgi:hypothetical protein
MIKSALTAKPAQRLRRIIVHLGSPIVPEIWWAEANYKSMKKHATADNDSVNLANLLKLRLLVARFGEMDRARWWNTRGVLGRFGEMALVRGFPKTQALARARIVFAVAARRCQDVFDPPHAMTLWKLPVEIEDRFEANWSDWAENSAEWSSFLTTLEDSQSDDLLGEARRLELATDEMIEQSRQLRRSAENRAVPIPGEQALSDRVVALLALGFFRGEPGSPAVPYARLGG